MACSSLYRSAPMGPANQPDYVNAVMAVETALAPLALLDALQALETAFGRVRHGERWGPRTLDLDILLYGSEILATDRLTVPHPGLAEREFVLYPLQEIAPDLNIPGLGPLADLVRRCPRRGLSVIEEA
jgi:2-amino-4-hydroxy-6-hydroxymethyldihydropteridine diphosphokinase